MRVLIYQQFHPGHHYHYVKYLIPGLRRITSDITVAVTPEGRASEEFSTLLAPLAGDVRFDDSLPPGLDRILKNERWKLHTDLRHAVARVKPDYVLVPSGDPHTTVMGLFRLAGLGGLPGRPPAEIGVHFGRGSAAVGGKQLLRERIDEWKLAAAGWTRVHIVNLLFYEAIVQRGGALARAATFVPHPIGTIASTGRTVARRALGLPEDGRLIGVAGEIDRRKAIGELLAAFKAIGGRPTDRILLAGSLHPMHRETIRLHHSDLVGSGRLIVMDEFLDRDAYQAVFSAVDLMCVPYPGFAAVSSVLLESLAAGRPVLANDAGWCRVIVDRFAAGWACDVLDPAAFASTLRQALDECEGYRQTEAITRLLAFHSPENFVALWLERVNQLCGQPPAEMRTWDWVVSACAAPAGPRSGQG
jgi:glycosyltransferase involved in cell wall biosynthesis